MKSTPIVLIIPIIILIAGGAFAQTRLIIAGDVKDSGTKEPLAYATVGVKNFVDQTVSDAEGKFELSIPAAAHRDTLVITYVGYERFEKSMAQLASVEHVLLKESATMLDEVRIVHRQLDMRQIDQNARIIRGNLYALHTEVTNAEYNDFLAWLEDYNKTDQRKLYEFNLDSYQKSVRDFYRRYHKPSAEKTSKKASKKDSKKDSVVRYDNYPAVNITYEGAVEYCKWLTERYNESPKKKKFRKVIFRLPTLKEWQIAALGYDKFQSWNLLDNTVEVIVQKDSTAMATNATKGERRMIKVDDKIWYPWYWVYFYRNKPYNSRGCFLGNFKVEHEVEFHCPANAPAFDGFTMMSHVHAYFPNNIGLFDIVGNVAEMIDEKGKACGGSWNDLAENSTIQSVKTYKGPDETVGFRVFMEVIEK